MKILYQKSTQVFESVCEWQSGHSTHTLGSIHRYQLLKKRTTNNSLICSGIRHCFQKNFVNVTCTQSGEGSWTSATSVLLSLNFSVAGTKSALSFTNIPQSRSFNVRLDIFPILVEKSLQIPSQSTDLGIIKLNAWGYE